MDDANERPDDTLVAATQRGSTTAFDELVRRYHARMVRLAYHFVRNEEDARDVAQDAFLRAFAGIGGYRLGSRFDRWLARIVVNRCRDLLRRRARVHFEGPSAIPADLRATSPTPDAAAEWNSLQARFRRELTALPADWRVVFLLHEQEGMGHDEIALLLGMNPRTVRWRLHRARQRLRDRLRDALPTE